MAYNATVTLVGNLGADVEIINPEGGKLFASFSLATTDSYKEAVTGEWKDMEAQWHDCLVFNPKVIEQVETYSKGARIEVTGSLTYKSREVFDESGKSFKIKQARVIVGRVQDAALEKNVA